MPGCAAIGCNNRSEKGFSMKCFPRDPRLRHIWKEKVGRANWEPSKNSFLCHMHFQPDQWTKMENGRIKLKRDAMPSIFTEISTRKSPNKQRMKKESEGLNDYGNMPVIGAIRESEDDNYTLEYLDDCEYEVTLASRGNGLKNLGKDFAEGKKNCNFAYHIISEKDIKGLEKENIIIVSDENNKEIGKLIHNNESIIIVADENNKEIGQLVVQENLLAQSNENMHIKPKINVLGDDYDDIEAKLNQICNGDNVTITPAEPEALTDTNMEPKLDEGGANNMAIVKSQSELPQKLVSLDNKKQRTDNKEQTELHGVIEVVENESELNIRAAMRRQKRTRKDVMRSIERTIARLSEKTFQSVKNDELTRSILSLARARQKGDREKRNLGRGYKRGSEVIENKFELGNFYSSKKSKFTIKVTGDDVTGIMEGLESSRFSDGQERSIGSLRSGEEDQFSECNSMDFVDCDEIHDHKYRGVNRKQILKTKQQTLDIDNLFKRNKNFIHTEEFDKKIQRGRKLSTEDKDGSKIYEHNSEDENEQPMWKKYVNKSQESNRDLKQKIKAQQEVIGKLTNQLIIYKGLEAKLAALNVQLQVKTNEIQALKNCGKKELQSLVQDQADDQKDGDVKDNTISNLRNRVNRLKEANKRLMEKIAVESQDKKLSFHLKQRDEQIKVLNWKLEKASKFLDRAEKNANTYKRKMVSLQTSMRRQKAAEERRNHFKELLIDNAKHEFSDDALLTALDIKNCCGRKCYEKLLGYNFPLPSLRTLRRRFPKEHVAEDDWMEEEGLIPEDESRMEAPLLTESAETEVTGTVQDIFEENNDTEDLNSSELGEHIFLQLDNERKYEKT